MPAPPIVANGLPAPQALVNGVTKSEANGVHFTPEMLPADLTLTDRLMYDVEMLLMGAFQPLSGFMTKADYDSCLDHMRLASGEVWSIPIVLPVPKSSLKAHEECRCGEGGEGEGKILKLRNSVGTIVAEVDVQDVHEPDVYRERVKVLGSDDDNHPYAKHMKNMKMDECVYVGGPIRAVHPIVHFNFRELRRTAKEVREMIKQRKWEVVVGFQTRNPMHRSHFELTKQALREATEMTGKTAHLLLTPAVGPTQPGDVEYFIRVRCYKKILPFYGNDSVDLVLLPLAMRMAGPREAVWHAIIRRNFGCTHFIVGRDHAGPSTRKKDGTPFYGPYDAHALLKQVGPELGILPIFGREMKFVGEENGGYLQADKTPEGMATESISGTLFRKMLETREPVPEWYSFPAVVAELHKFYRPKTRMGFCMYFTGLPCSGKSTLATAIEASILENEREERKVTVLDADIIRTHLSKGLGFSRGDRQLNVRRIAYVASEIVKHGGICLVANIAPYAEDRAYNRQLINAHGGYIEVYVSTPLEVCEQRDVKELYKKARLGIIQQFTGISDPYEAPTSAEIAVNSSENLDEKVASVMNYLRQCGWIEQKKV